MDLKIILVGFAVAPRVAVIFDLFGADLERTCRARMRTVNGHDLGAEDPSADPNLDHFTVERFSWLVLCLGKLEFRAAGLPNFDVPDVLAAHSLPLGSRTKPVHGIPYAYIGHLLDTEGVGGAKPLK
jgi:hypothetical protein